MVKEAFITRLKERGINIDISTENVKTVLAENSDTIKNIVITIGSKVLSFFSSIPTIIMYIIITIMATIFMCFDKEYVKNMVKKHVPKVFLNKLKLVFKETCGIAINYIKAEAKLSCVCFIIVLTRIMDNAIIWIRNKIPNNHCNNNRNNRFITITRCWNCANSICYIFINYRKHSFRNRTTSNMGNLGCNKTNNRAKSRKQANGNTSYIYVTCNVHRLQANRSIWTNARPNNFAYTKKYFQNHNRQRRPKIVF